MRGECLAQEVERRFTSGVALECLLDERGALAVDHHLLGAVIVLVSNRREARIFAPSHLLTQAALGVFRKRIHIVFAESEFAMEHELSLGRVLKPGAGEFERLQRSRIEEVNNPPAVHAIARQAVGMPRENSLRFAGLDPPQHGVENRPAGCFGGLLLHKLLNDVYALPGGKLAQFIQLRVNREDLLVLDVGGFTSIKKEVFHGSVYSTPNCLHVQA